MSQYGVMTNGMTAVAEIDEIDEIAQRDAPGGEHHGSPQAAGGTDELRTLCAQAAELVGRVPGNLRRIAVRGVSHAVEIEWHEAAQPVMATPSAAPAMPHSGVLPLPEENSGPAGGGGLPAGAHVVVAPLVGTFYRAPEPGASPFVEIGDRVEAGQTVGIVEAMKLMNPVVAETAGRIGAIYVGNGEAVEFGQNLVRVDVDGHAG